MKPLHIHIAFAIAAAVCTLLLLWTGHERCAALLLNRAIAAPGPDSHAAEPAEVTLARGIRFARAGDGKQAERAYQQVLQQGSQPLRLVAHYNLANLQMRQALQLDGKDPQFLPKVEIAKQQYRAVLLEMPGHWDARYNLERALWLAPEAELLPASEETATPHVRAPKPMMVEPGDLP